VPTAPSFAQPSRTGRGNALPKLFRTDMLKATFATVLAYGPGGAGKTYSIRTLKDGRKNPIVIACELGETHGLLSLQSDGVPFVVVQNHAELIEVVREMKKKPGKIEYEQEEFGSVVLDSLTQWGEFPLERYAELKGWEDLATPAAHKDPRMAYGFLAEKGRQLYKEMFSLHGHLYIIAREGLFGGEGEPQFAAPELPGQKLPREVPGWPDATVRLRVVSGKHVMVTQGEGGSPARVRLPADYARLPLRCNPNISALMDYMCGDRNALRLLEPASKEATGNQSASASTGATAPTSGAQPQTVSK